ncbi:MAG: hypothetical protein CMA59_00785 [Euryarchaeota archaeon]|nr:hypothetical protein [Euryarchaeota archaeon]
MLLSILILSVKFGDLEVLLKLQLLDVLFQVVKSLLLGVLKLLVLTSLLLFLTLLNGLLTLLLQIVH